MHGLPTINDFIQRFMNQRAHLLRGRGFALCVTAAEEISRAVTIVKYLAHRSFDRQGILFQACGMAQQHGCGQNGAERVGDALAGAEP